MQGYAFNDGFEDRLLRSLDRDHDLIGPVRVEGVGCRLKKVGAWEDLTFGELPLIPLKKHLLPPNDLLWCWTEEGPSPAPPPERPVALVGIAPCDLMALDYLDRVFEDDRNYRLRRERLITVGTECEPGEQCFCPAREEMPSFDLFLGHRRLWTGSDRGEELIAPLREELSETGKIPPAILNPGTAPPLPADLEGIFYRSAGLPLWERVGSTCLSCGACSAVCPTCYCYHMVDEARPDGNVTRSRLWDNCFFRSHALVAGGHNFRPNRAERLRFRFEHKLLGFGPLRGTPSCVGCGRCRRACPVEIDISEVLVALTGREAP